MYEDRPFQGDDYQLPIPTNASKNSISKFAEQLAESLYFGPSDDIHSITSKLGGKINISDQIEVDGPIPESMIVENDHNFEIFISCLTSVARDRFTIAHELGHLFLHYPMVKKKYGNVPMKATRWVEPNDAVQNRAEWEANWFAASFLMPEKRFREIFEKYKSLDEDVADFFGVSIRAVQIRAESLGLF